MVDAARAHESQRLSNAKNPSPFEVSTTRCKIKNSSGASRARGEVLEITGYLPTTFSRKFLWFTGGSPSPAINKRYAILMWDAKSNDIVDAIIAGICAAQVNITNSAHKTATISSATYVLQSAANGPIPIYYQPSGTGQKECAIILPAVINYKPLVRFTLSAALGSSDASKTATIQSQFGHGMDNPNTGAGAITVHNLLTHSGGVYKYFGDSGDAGMAVWDSANDYRILDLECP